MTASRRPVHSVAFDGISEADIDPGRGRAPGHVTGFLFPKRFARTTLRHGA